ncbi:hypothetical protein GW7_07603 [Heterocephalus glaber]|uniref:Uncharacterized protein n=1 Tax=Heterocephalus glaber TaxID=10181 RepID=G5C482_HETGA|nr:hypothetical protein GW7_07603 [Heterocephalus glaber]
MAPKPGQESEEEQVPLALAGREPVGNDSGPPATIPTDTMASSCPCNTRPPSTEVGSISTKLVLEALDPWTLRLLWEQRELEIQALRWAIWRGQHARQQHILQECVMAVEPFFAADLEVGTAKIASPPKSSHSQDTFLQNQVQKLTVELRAQKEQAQLERECLEAQLAQTMDKLQQLEAELQAFQKSCLLHLAQSSWLGRILWSQTGSVEVITTDTLMEPGDSSEGDQKPTAGELVERQHKSLEWSTLPLEGTSSSGIASLDSSSRQLVLHPWVQKVIGHPPPAADAASSEQIEVLAKSFSGDSEGGLRACGSLQIVAVSHREKFLGILNCSSPDTADLGGLVLRQRVLSEHQAPLHVTSGLSIFANNTDWSIDRFPLPKAGAGPNPGHLQRRPQPSSQGRAPKAEKPVHPREVPAQPEGAKLKMSEPLPTIPEAAWNLEPGVLGKECRVCVRQRGVDLGCPMVALSVQSTAESRFGFCFLCCPPITADVHLWQV